VISAKAAHYLSSIAKCEYEALKTATEVADVFNAPIGDESWSDRVHQEFIAERLGFAPWMAQGEVGTAAQQLGGWKGKKIEDSPYAVLNRKWVYMFGDSTTRQVWSSFAAPFQENNFERNSKEWSRHYVSNAAKQCLRSAGHNILVCMQCNKQEHRFKHVKGGIFPEEGWRGPCGVNEVTCHVAGYGEGGLLTFDWKHFPYEDYDEYLFGPDGPWVKGFSGEGTRTPEILTLQLGLHSCWHSNPQGLYSKELTEVNETMVNDHLLGVYKLFGAVRKAIKKSGMTKTVILVTSGFTGFPNSSSIDECVTRFNRVSSQAAHLYGFAVLERGEIERRLMFKSVQSSRPHLSVEMHLPQPAQNLVSTVLVQLMSCLNTSAVDMTNNLTPEQEAAADAYRTVEPANHISTGNGSPVHNPPQ
jgi:hypothetical protein